jgi:uncharacterized repeat protein (TIGR01451 family)
VWGERPDAPIAQPSIDAGSNIVPLSSLALQKSFFLRDSLDCSGTINTGDTVRFRLQYFNNAAFGGNVNVTLQDDLPPQLSYVAGSTQLDGVAIPDAPGDLAPFSSAAGGLVALSSQGGSGLLTFDAVITEDVTAITNRANATATLLGEAQANVTIPLDTTVRPILQVKKDLLDPSPNPATWGQVVTFGLTITNTSSQVTISQLALQDKFNATDLTFLRANLPPDIATAGVLTWTNLISDGLLLPNETLSLQTAFQVNQVPETVTEISNQASFENVANDTGTTRIVCRAEATISIVAPTPTATPTVTPPPPPPSPPTPEGTPGNPTAQPPPIPPPDTTPTSLPPGTSTVTPPPTTSVTPTPTFPPGVTQTIGITPTGTVIPVNLLPETGNKSPEELWVGPLLIGVAIGLYLILKSRKMT